MSDTTSFLGGAALAGLAALVVLKGGISLGSPSATMPPTFSMPQVPGFNVNSPATSPMPLTPLPNPGGASLNSEHSGYEEAKRQLKLEQLQAQMEQQQQKINAQQAMIDTLTAQSKFSQPQQLAPNPPISPQGVPQIVHPYGMESSNSVMSGLPWALGGVLLTFGGGIALVGMFTLFARQQQRSNRTVEYFQEDYPAYFPPQRRRVQVLPPRRVIKRVNLEEEE
jgi:hypothetical protein